MRGDEEERLDRALAQAVASARRGRGLSVAELARVASVSRAMIAKIERAEAQPSAALLGRLSGALGLTLSQLVARAEGDDERHRPRERQPTWTDPGTGYVRRAVTRASAPVEIVDVVLPPHEEVAYEAAAYFRHHVLWVLEGRLDVEEGEDRHRLASGDSLTLGAPSRCVYRNPSSEPTRYAVVLGP